MTPITGESTSTELDRLTSEHRALKERLHELSEPNALTSAERVERAQLKRRKLHAQERILQLQEH